jgi:cell division protein FtsW (lipid II flippase)
LNKLDLFASQRSNRRSPAAAYQHGIASTDTQPLEIQGRWLLVAAAFVILYAAGLTISLAVRTHSWSSDLRWEHWVGVGSWIVAFGVIQWQARSKQVESDPAILIIAAFLCGLGVLTIYRIIPEFGHRQSVWLLLGGFLVAGGLRLPSELLFLRRYKYLWLTGGLLLVGLTLIFGTNPLGGGPRLWLGCCGFFFQPSEPLKLLLIVYLAAYLADRFSQLIPASQSHGKTPLLPVLAPTLLLSGIALALLVVQRDLGTAIILLFLYATMTYLATGQYRIPLISLVVVGIIGAAGYLLFDLIELRITAWINPWLDPAGRSYQIIQSLMAVANGGLFGRGPGLGSPGLVPVSFSDFIYAAISEETGLIGAAGLVLALALMVHRGVLAALRARNNFLRYLAAGLTAYLVGQSILIIGGNIRLLPLTGVTLPFVSYGGSSLTVSFLSILLLLHITRRDYSQAYPLAEKKPYLQLASLLMAGLGAIVVLSGWWAIVRSETLLTRPDNPRRYVNDLYSPRGGLLDRANQILAETTGQSGTYQRNYRYPDLSPILGYSSAIYGQVGLEASLDGYLRGAQGTPAATVWWHYLTYGQHPEGLDVRLSLDANLQGLADELMKDQKGAVVLMDAASGEILIMASHPGFDANQLTETWESLIQSPDAPLLNRVTLGSYQPGTALGPIWLAGTNNSAVNLPDAPPNLNVRLDNAFLSCAVPPGNSLEETVAAGCPGSSVSLVEALAEQDPALPQEVLTDFGLFSTPQIRLPVSSASIPEENPDLVELATGQSSLRVNPLQMAIAASAITHQGSLPASRITLAVDTPQSSWVVLPPLSTSSAAVTGTAAAQTSTQLTSSDKPYWETIARAPSGEQTITWYLAGTLPNWSGTPLTLVVLLEEDAPAEAIEIGENILQEALGLP